VKSRSPDKLGLARSYGRYTIETYANQALDHFGKVQAIAKIYAASGGTKTVPHKGARLQAGVTTARSVYGSAVAVERIFVTQSGSVVLAFNQGQSELVMMVKQHLKLAQVAMDKVL
jgi:hypothetical protein